MALPEMTIVGNLTDDPILRFTNAGRAVANFTVAASKRILNEQTNQWEEAGALFQRCTVWGKYAENVAESLHKGDNVIAVGQVAQRSYTTRDTNEERHVVEMNVREVGVALRYATAQVVRNPRDDQSSGGWGQGQQQRPAQGQNQGQYQGQQVASGPAGNPQGNQAQWGAPAGGQPGDSWGGGGVGYAEEPPF